MICIHIARDVRTPIAYLETPTRDELGRLLCHDCNRRRSLDTLRLACPECVADILRARELRP
jgi:Zn finger protein HypA/HybF involved in hydrogenase expression